MISNHIEIGEKKKKQIKNSAKLERRVNEKSSIILYAAASHSSALLIVREKYSQKGLRFLNRNLQARMRVKRKVWERSPPSSPSPPVQSLSDLKKKERKTETKEKARKERAHEAAATRSNEHVGLSSVKNDFFYATYFSHREGEEGTGGDTLLFLWPRLM